MTINSILKNHNLTNENAIIYNSRIENTEFDNCFKMTFENKTNALEVVEEKLMEDNLVLIICHSESILMTDYADMLESIETQNTIKLCIYGDDSLVEFIVYMLY